jgi:hypothetical protein
VNPGEGRGSPKRGQSEADPRRREAIRKPPSAAARPSAPPWWSVAACAALTIAACGDVFRLGFFADDFHFLDVARRVPLLQALNGQYGIYPWYRPLSRELFFEAIVAAGPARVVAGHVANLLALAGSVWLVRRIGGALLGARAGVIATVLFATYAYTKFVASWASGFQDVLAMLLTLLAVEASIRGRQAHAVLWAGLAPFAKESGFIAGPLVVLYLLLSGRASGARRWILAQVGAFAAAIVIHLAVRATWNTAGSSVVIERLVIGLALTLAQIAGGFVSLSPVATLEAVLAAALAAIATAALLRAARDEAGAPSLAPRRALAFLVFGVAGALGPLVVGHLTRLSSLYAYYGFPATPWLAVLAAAAIARVPRRAGNGIAIALAAWNVLALAYRAPDLASPDAWRFRRWDWNEAERLSAISSRLAADLRADLSARPESLVIVYREVPQGCFFQTEDGPAARESLGDRTVRAYWINEAPYRIDPERLAFVRFEQTTQHLARERLPTTEWTPLAATALAAGRAAQAWLFASAGDATERTQLHSRYMRAGAALIAEGIAGYTRELGAGGLLDTTSGAVAREVSELRLPGGLGATLTRVFEHPLTVAPHEANAESLVARDIDASAAVELRIVSRLDPARLRSRLRLGMLLAGLGETDSARVELERLAAAAPGTTIDSLAHRVLERISAASTPHAN